MSELLRPLKLLLFFAGILIASFSTGQILQPVAWNFSQEKIAENLYELRFSASIDAGWYIYGTDLPPGGPIPTAITIAEGAGFRTIGQLRYSRPAEKFDPNFNMTLQMFSGVVVFRQQVEVTGSQPVAIRGELVYMACDDTRCLPPDFVEFSFNLPARTGAAATGVAGIPAGQVDAATDTLPVGETEAELEQATIAGEQLADGQPDDGEKEAWFWGTFVLGFLGGLLALLTPCVFPMIPLTVSFFVRNAGNKSRATRDGLLYGFTIVFAYVILGIAISMIFGANALNAIATSPAFNIFFFTLLVLFAASFLGAFELTLPSSWSTALDGKADKTGGLIGVLLMGLTFVIISFSCTGPIVGTLLVQAATSGEVFAPAAGMFGFSLALAIPFALFAMFPAALKSLPKSGGWMNTVKVVLGFIVLAFSLKFLSTADAVGQWGILSREIYLAIWIALFLLLGLYLIGKIKFAHDSDLKHLGVGRLMLAVASFAFVVYLIPGLWGAPLKAISSMLPSQTKQEFDLSRGFGGATHTPAAQNTIYVGESVMVGPHGLLSFRDYQEGLEAARRVGKPIFLDFTGLGCANCRKMEANVWSDPRVLEMLANDFVKISLFVDDRTELPADQQFVSTAFGRERRIRTVGQKWSLFQAERYGVNSQPYYLILGHDESLLAPPHAFDLNIERFIEFLETGKRSFTRP